MFTDVTYLNNQEYTPFGDFSMSRWKPKEKYEIVETFLEDVTTKLGTRATFRSYLNRYFRELGIANPNSYFKSRRNYVKDVEKFVKAIDKIPDRTQQSLLSCVKLFLENNDKKITTNQWGKWIRRNNLENPQSTMDDKIPTNQDLKTLLEYAMDIKTRSLILFLSSTGLRVGEALQVTIPLLKNDWSNNHIRLPADMSKTHRVRHIFYTDECKDLLENWLKVRDKYIDTKYSKSIYARKNKISKDDRVFPFTYETATKIWNRLLERAGEPFNEKDFNPKLHKARYKYHIHTIRKHWFSSLMNEGMNANFVNYIGGHESLLGSTYSDLEKQPELLKKNYDEFSQSLLIFSTTNLSGINSELDEVRKDSKQKDEKIRDITQEMLGIKQELLEMKLELLQEKQRQEKKLKVGKKK